MYRCTKHFDLQPEGKVNPLYRIWNSDQVKCQITEIQVLIEA